jgi:hypothetical protein
MLSFLLPFSLSPLIFFPPRRAGKITKRGVFAPLEPEIFMPLITLLDQEGLGCKEELVIE